MTKAAQQGEARANEWIDAGKSNQRTSEQVEDSRESAAKGLYTDLVAFQNKSKAADYTEECRAVTRKLVSNGTLPDVHLDAGEKTRKFDVVGTSTDKTGMVVAVGRKADGHAEQVAVLAPDGKMHEALPDFGPDGKLKGYHAGRVYSTEDIKQLERGKLPDSTAPAAPATDRCTQKEQGSVKEYRGDVNGPTFIKMTVDGNESTIERKPGTNEYVLRDENGERRVWNVRVDAGRVGYVDRTEDGNVRHNVITPGGKHQSWFSHTQLGDSGVGTDTILTIQDGKETKVLTYRGWHDDYIDKESQTVYKVLQRENSVTLIDPNGKAIRILVP